MFDNKELEAYRNIKVPSELKTRILADCNAENEGGKRKIGGAFPSKRWIQSLSAVAACFAIAVAIFSMTRTDASIVALSYEGTTVSSERIAIQESAALAGMESRTVTPMGIPLSVDVRGEAEITVSDGSLYCVSEDGDQVTELGQTARIQGRTDVWWSVFGSGSYELTVTANGKDTVYVLDMTELAPNGVIYKK